MPKFVIVVPNYNSADTVGEALESAIYQNYSDYQVVACDNASTDDSPNVINMFDHPKLQKLLFSERLEKTQNWNRAYKTAPDCEYLVTLHSDDKLSANALKYLDSASIHKPSLIHGAFIPISYSGMVRTKVKFPISYDISGTNFLKLLLLRNIVAVPGVSIKQSDYLEIGGWSEKYTYYQDVDMWYQAAKLGRISYTSKILGLYRDKKMHDQKAECGFFLESLIWYLDKLNESEEPSFEPYIIKGLARVLSILPTDFPAQYSSENERLEHIRTLALEKITKYKFILSNQLHQRLLRLAFAIGSRVIKLH